MDKKIEPEAITIGRIEVMENNLEKILKDAINDIKKSVIVIKNGNDCLFSNYEKRIQKLEENVKTLSIFCVCLLFFCVALFVTDLFHIKKEGEFEKREEALEQAIEEIKEEIKSEY